MHIAVLEDDTDQLSLLTSLMQSAGHEVTGFTTGDAMMRAIREGGYDLYLVDWELPDTSGLSVLKWLRRTLEVKTPVIFTTARDEEEDIVAALRAGADDYLIKPLKPTETLARVEAVCRRFDSIDSDPEVLEAGNIRLDSVMEKAYVNNEEIELTRREFGLLWMLMENLGSPVPRDQILTEVWGIKGSVITRTVDTHISRLRRKIPLTPEHGWELKSIYHHGYRLEQLQTG